MGDAITLLDKKSPSGTSVSGESSVLGYSDITIHISFSATADRPKMSVHIEESIDNGDTWISVVRVRTSQAFKLGHRTHLLRATASSDDVLVTPVETVTVKLLGVRR